MQHAQVEPEWVWRMSLEDYHRMIDCGAFDEDDKLEFLEGYIVAMSPQSPEHADIITALNAILVRTVGDRYRVGVQTPLTLARSEPEPDLTVVDPKTPRGRGRHPSTALLVIEISRDSLRKDLGIKARLYAEAAVAEYWVIDTEHRGVHVFRDPDPAAGVYRDTLVVSEGALTSTSLPAVSVELAAVFAFDRRE